MVQAGIPRKGEAHMEKRKGLFITLEGPDGSGKTTQFRLLSARLKMEKFPMVETREPGGHPLSEKIRVMLLSNQNEHPPAPQAELLLFLAARAQHVHDVIRPALERGELVLCERFSDSTYAYQVGGRKLSPAFFKTGDQFATGGLSPDLTLLFQLPLAEGLSRAFHVKQGYDRMESETPQFFRRVHQAYQTLARRDPRRIRVIPANRPVDVVSKAVWRAVENRLSLWLRTKR